MQICPVCSNTFTPTGHSPQVTCSHKCGGKFLWQTKRIKEKGRYGACLYCSKPIYITQSRPDKRFCGHSCASKSLHKKTGKIIECIVCGKERYIQLRMVGKAKYCSISCAKKRWIQDHPEHNKNIKRKSGEDHPSWKGGRRKHSSGYILISVGKKYQFEHRYVMEQYLGRSLERKEHVHHINGDKADNRIENLMLFSTAREHANYHVSLNGLAHR